MTRKSLCVMKSFLDSQKVAAQRRGRSVMVAFVKDKNVLMHLGLSLSKTEGSDSYPMK